MSNDCKVCIQSLAAYNNGRLINEWLDFPIHEDDLDAAKARVLSRGGGEELMIADSAGFPFRVGEYDSLTKLNEWAEVIEDRQVDEDALRAYCDNMNVGADSDPHETIRAFEAAYIGEYRRPENFAMEHWYGVEQIPEEFHCYIDWDSVARTMLSEGFFENNGYYFYNH
jgi:antirestriction protein